MNRSTKGALRKTNEGTKQDLSVRRELRHVPEIQAGRQRETLDLVVHGAMERGEALCCDATLVSPLRAEGLLSGTALPCNTLATEKSGATPSCRRRGPTASSCCQVGGRWGCEAVELVKRFARLRTQRAPLALRASALAGWRRRWWGILAVAQQKALTSGLPCRPLRPGRRQRRCCRAMARWARVVLRCVARRPQPPAPGAAYSHSRPLDMRRQEEKCETRLRNTQHDYRLTVREKNSWGKRATAISTAVKRRRM